MPQYLLHVLHTLTVAVEVLTLPCASVKRCLDAVMRELPQPGTSPMAFRTASSDRPLILSFHWDNPLPMLHQRTSIMQLYSGRALYGGFIEPCSGFGNLGGLRRKACRRRGKTIFAIFS
jgi:hypothetical protein